MIQVSYKNKACLVSKIFTPDIWSHPRNRENLAQHSVLANSLPTRVIDTNKKKVALKIFTCELTVWVQCILHITQSTKEKWTFFKATVIAARVLPTMNGGGNSILSPLYILTTLSALFVLLRNRKKVSGLQEGAVTPERKLEKWHFYRTHCKLFRNKYTCKPPTMPWITISVKYGNTHYTIICHYAENRGTRFSSAKHYVRFSWCGN